MGTEKIKKPKRLDLTGGKFKTYTVIEKVGKNQFGTILWKCICVCGIVVVHQSGNLTTGSVRCSCQRLTYGENAFRDLYYSYKRSATIRAKRAFELDREVFRALVTANCHYCGIEPRQRFESKIDEFLYNGIDRVDNAKGYLPDNVVTCCGTCNKAKHTMTQPEFLGWVARVYKHILQ